MTAERFLLDLDWADVPARVRSRLESLLLDFAACSAAGRATPTARLAAEYSSAQHSGTGATALFDGRRLGPVGAAFANGVLANALDFDDGHRLAKGHPGANVIPAALAAAETAGSSREELLVAILAGYDIAIRAAVDLHSRSEDYHASGAWGALGAAAAAARLLRLDAATTRHALGLAEYHAPIAPIMRSVAEPAMTKDACGWGAATGLSSALLARDGFTAVPSDFSERAAGDLGGRWELLDVYVKEYPCCRWSHPAIAAAAELRAETGLRPERIARVRVRTFAAAAALASRLPRTTEEAQYSLVWPVATALATGRFGVEHVLPGSFSDTVAARLLSLVDVEVDSRYEDAFPASRRSAVAVELDDGTSYESGPREAPGEPDDPRWEAIVSAKAAATGLDGFPELLLGAPVSSRGTESSTRRA